MERPIRTAQRPVTSKSRGICQYYTTPRGCFSGAKCKFLHGANEKLTPFDKSKTCRYYAQGRCLRGEDCWFLHVVPQVPGSLVASSSSLEDEDDMCCICYEKPTSYGLLGGCSHVFCLTCIRQWRDPAGKTGDVKTSGMIKKCPLCRESSRFITPSSRFFPHGHPGKTEMMEAHKASMARVPCRALTIRALAERLLLYFLESKTSFSGNRPICPFGGDCFYQHNNDDGTPHVFTGGIEHNMGLYWARRRRATTSNSLHPLAVLNRIFVDNPMDELSATIDAIRASLPALMPANVDDDMEESGVVEWSGDAGLVNVQELERLTDHMLSTLASMRDGGEGESIENTGTQPNNNDIPRNATHEDEHLSGAIVAIANMAIDIAQHASRVADVTRHTSEANPPPIIITEVPRAEDGPQGVADEHAEDGNHIFQAGELLAWLNGTTALDPASEVADEWEEPRPSTSQSNEMIGLAVSSSTSAYLHAGWAEDAGHLRSVEPHNGNTGEEESDPVISWGDFWMESYIPDTTSSAAVPEGSSTPRFSTVVGRNVEEDRLIINIDDDEEEEERQVDCDVNAEEILEEESEVSATQVETLEPSVAESISTPIEATTPTSPHPQASSPATEPPFVTDGRGRVVWSSSTAREASGRRKKARRERVLPDVGSDQGASVTSDGWGRTMVVNAEVLDEATAGNTPEEIADEDARDADPQDH